MRYAPERFTHGQRVIAAGKPGTVLRHRTDALVEVKRPDGTVVTVESRDVRKEGGR